MTMLIWFSRASHLRNTNLSTGIKNNTRDKLCLCEELQILTVLICNITFLNEVTQRQILT